MSDTSAPVTSRSAKSDSSQMPATRLGWAAVWLALGFVVLMVAAVITGAVLRIGGPLAAAPGIAAMASAVAGAICAAIALIKGERSWALFVSLVPGLASTFLLVGEFGSALLGFTH